jgi:hypothetical protein
VPESLVFSKFPTIACDFSTRKLIYLKAPEGRAFSLERYLSRCEMRAKRVGRYSIEI